MELNFIFNNFFTIDNLDLELSTIENYCYELKKTDQGTVRSNYGGWHSSDIDFNNSVIQPLLIRIKNRTQQILEITRMNHRYKVSNMWININGQNDYNQVHRHPFSFLSGVFYVRSKNNCGDLIFKNPNILHENYIRPSDVVEYNGFNSDIWRISPVENNLIMFPSWLEHFTNPNESGDDRISISFNIELT
jgi:uncharacterized protein (TIGR02466 family)